MKRVLTVAIVIVLCLMIAVPVATADVTKANSPVMEAKLVKADLNGLALDDCVLITTIEDAKNGNPDITAEEKAALLAAYEGLENGTASLPIEGNYVVRELVDISFKNAGCRQLEDHGKKNEVLAQEGVVLTVDFDMGVDAAAKVVVMTYINNKWEEIVSAENNGDGTVTCVFEDLCPVAFAVVE